MAKLKPAGSKKAKPSDFKGAIPCLVIVILGIVIMCLLFYFSLKGIDS